jgi:RNA polymerase sigma-70 factor (ECF subfamily)
LPAALFLGFLLVFGLPAVHNQADLRRLTCRLPKKAAAARVNSPSFASLPVEGAMPQTPAWQPERFRSLLRLKVRHLQRDPRFRRRFDSSDLVQETLLRAHQNLEQFRGQTEAELVKWLEVILGHVVLGQIREATAGKRDVRLEQSLQALLAESSVKLAAFLTADQPSPSGQVERRELLVRVAEALDQLPEDQRDVILLRYVSDTPLAQIAEQLGRTPKSVAGLLRRGLQRLRELLADNP